MSRCYDDGPPSTISTGTGKSSLLLLVVPASLQFRARRHVQIEGAEDYESIGLEVQFCGFERESRARVVGGTIADGADQHRVAERLVGPESGGIDVVSVVGGIVCDGTGPARSIGVEVESHEACLIIEHE